MFKVELYFLRFLLISSIFITACVANSQQVSSKKIGSETEITTESKKQLARQVLSEIGIAQQYDLYLNNVVDISDSSFTGKLGEWLHGVLVQEAGWKQVEDQYIASLAAHFSEVELTELLNLSKQPLIKKLLQAEIQAYGNTSKQRRKLLDKVLSDYNDLKITPPPEVLK